MAKRKYDASSIQTLGTAREQVRERPTIFIPSKDEAGAMHIIFEVIDNSIDELAVADSVGDHVSVTFDEKTKVVTVADNGSGIPQEKLLDVCTVLYTSGKLNNNGDTHYEFSAGVNGIGAKLPCYLSEWCEVSSMQRGKKLTYKFKDGYLVDTIEEKCKDRGTSFKFKLDNNLIKINKLDTKELIRRYEEKSFIMPKVKLNLSILSDGVIKKKYSYTGKTIADRVEMMNPDTDVITGNSVERVDVLLHVEDEKLTKVPVPVRFALAFKEEAVDEEDPDKFVISYGNTVKTYTGGVHVDAMKDAVVRFFRNDIQPGLGKRDSSVPVVPSDIYSGICAFIITKVQNPEFKGQYKDKLMNAEARIAVRDCVYNTLKQSKPSFQKKMTEFVLRVARGRLESKKARTKGKDVSNSFSKDRIDKFKPIFKTAETFEPELILVEGDAAAGLATSARDPYNQAIYPIKKPKNIFDADSDVDSDIVGVFNNIMAICNLKPGKHCDPSKSEMSRILCLTDGDIDGDLIAISAISLLAKHCKPLIDAGMVGRIVPPAYSFPDEKKKGEKIFVRSQRDFYKELSKKFVKNFTLEKGSKTYSKSEFSDFVEMNFEYNIRLSKLADRYTCDPKLMEYIASKYHGKLTEQKQSYWSNAMKAYRDISVVKEEGYLLIDGTIGMEPYHIAMDEYFDKHVRRFKEFQDKNATITGFKLNGKEMTVYEVMHEFEKYIPAGVKRYKGLGELEVDEMRKLCIDREKRTVAIFKFKDYEKDMENLDIAMSSQAKFRRARKTMMQGIEIEDLDLDT